MISITDYDGLQHLCEVCGITESYYDISGGHHVAGTEAKLALLKAMGISIQCDADIHHCLEEHKLRHWRQLVEPVHVYRHGDSDYHMAVTLDSTQVQQPLRWQVIEENGHSFSGEWHFQIDHAAERCEFEGGCRYRFYVPLPAVSEPGYHRLNLQLIDCASADSLLIATPETCFQPDDLKTWGIGLQLYSLRSKRNWGIGDFTDLANVVEILAPLGVDVIGLNPLHALFPHLPENASPYSPTSRDFLNPIYLDIEAIEEFEPGDFSGNDNFQARLQALRDTELVDYTEVWRLKQEALDVIYARFRQDNSERTQAFLQYQAERGEELYRFSLFEALQDYFYQEDPELETWQKWPEEFQDPESVNVKNWAESNIERIEFYSYLQWQAEAQLSAVQTSCQQLGMRIGIYNDLAVGVEPFSAACWAEQPHYALDVGVGAPPDDFNLLGQNWGLPPQLPQVLRDDAYRPFIQTLSANMRNAGALRIDHVMGLMRLYWVPEDYTADQGTYVSYPMADLLGILALESQRNRCLIVGEDLGTVPNEVRHQLWLKKILSYRILFFEKDWHEGRFRSPQEYPEFALCTSGSHDLPTMKAYWQGIDLDLRETLNLYPSEEVEQQQRQAREQDRHAIKQALQQEQLIDDAQEQYGTELFLAIQRFLARSQSQLMMLQLEDIFGQTDQVNVPGTIDEYPNWRRKISIDLEDWLEKSEVTRIAEAISGERG